MPDGSPCLRSLFELCIQVDAKVKFTVCKVHPVTRRVGPQVE